MARTPTQLRTLIQRFSGASCSRSCARSHIASAACATHAAAHAHAARLLTQRTRSHGASMAHATRVAGPDVAAATVAFFTGLAPSGLVAAPVRQVARPSRRPHRYGAQRPAVRQAPARFTSPCCCGYPAARGSQRYAAHEWTSLSYRASRRTRASTIQNSSLMRCRCVDRSATFNYCKPAPHVEQAARRTSACSTSPRWCKDAAQSQLHAARAWARSSCRASRRVERPSIFQKPIEQE